MQWSDTCNDVEDVILCISKARKDTQRFKTQMKAHYRNSVGFKSEVIFTTEIMRI